MPQPKKIEILPSYLNKMINSHLVWSRIQGLSKGGGDYFFLQDKY